MSNKRFVNLNRATTYLPDPNGQVTQVRPFREALDERLRKPDGIYVVEGAFWQKYVSGTMAGPLHNYPSPKGFGLDSFPALPVYRRDGSAYDGAVCTDGSSTTPVAAKAVPGHFRLAGDVITPSGKIRRLNPMTGEDEEVDDTPANRSVIRPVNEAGPPPAQLRESIVDYLEAKGIETVEQFDKLTDDQLLQIPGMNPLAVKHVRENMRGLLQRIEDGKKAAYERLIADGYSDAEAREMAYGKPQSVASDDAEPASDEDDEDDDDETDEDTDDDSEESDEDDEDDDDADAEEGADGRTVGTPAEVAKSKERYAKPKPKPQPKGGFTPPAAPAKPKPATFSAKPAVVKKGGSPRHPNRRD